MAQQAGIQQKRSNGILIQCGHCDHIWLARSTQPLLTCSACHNHVIARDNTVTSDVLEQNQKVKGVDPT